MGFDCALLEDKLVDPLIKDADGFRETDYHEAFVLIAKKCQSIAAKYGKDAVAVAISDRYTNEEAYAMKKIRAISEWARRPFALTTGPAALRQYWDLTLLRIPLTSCFLRM